MESAASSVVGGLGAVASELGRLAARDWRDYAPWVAFWFALHGLFEVGVPWLAPGAYDVFNRGALAAGRKPMSRVALAKDIRTRLCAIAFSVHVVSVVCYGALMTDDHSRLRAQGLRGSTPLTRHLNLVRCAATRRCCARVRGRVHTARREAARALGPRASRACDSRARTSSRKHARRLACSIGYFTWDLWVSVADGFGPAFIFHGLASLVIFVLALAPAMHSMCFMALGFEASTIPLHLRRMMIMAGVGHGRVFTAVQSSFAATFFVCRIALAWPQTFEWAGLAVRELRAPTAGFHPAVMVLYMLLCSGLTLLNAWWMWEICVMWLGRAPVSARVEPLGRKAAAHTRS